ncbi:unnamed protein product [Symbiodinium natans]|uniref:Uncharacterized protein n=1 Tax=Symbiodinium natans TaxID=878477 RepID=A0A812MME1_9DINO|nr:unnamed protein product [Symbiodinium natans]
MEKGASEVESHFEFDFCDRGNWGIVIHCWCLGFVSGGFSAFLMGVVAGYLHVPSDIIRGLQNMSSLPNVLSVFMGVVSDSRPIFGYRRRPYMVLGWLITTIAYSTMACMGLPEPYFCTGPDGGYLYDRLPCNPDADYFYVPLAICLFSANIGLSVSGAAGRGLIVEYAKAEEEERRGRTQTMLEMVTLAGSFSSLMLAGFGFNGRLFNGSWDQRHQLGYRQYCSIYAVVGIIAGLSCIRHVREGQGRRVSMRQYFHTAWSLFQSKAVAGVGLFYFVRGVFATVFTTAHMWVMMEWAGVKSLQMQLVSMLGVCASLFGSWLLQKYMLNVSWRKIMVVATVVGVALDAFPTFLTIFGVVRNQYFFLGEAIVSAVPESMAVLVSSFIVNELADSTNCGLMAGLFTTISNVANPLGLLLGNQIFGLFQPALYDRDNFVEDTPAFRRTVAFSYGLTYAFILAPLLVLRLLPSQKSHAQRRKREWRHRCYYALLAAIVLSMSLLYTLVGDVFDMDPVLACHRFVGGGGCN